MFARGCPFPCVWNASSGSLPWGPCATAGKRGSVWGRWGSEPGSELRWLSLRPACWLEYPRDRTGLGQGGGGVRARLWSATNAGSCPIGSLLYTEREGLSPAPCARSAMGQGEYRCRGQTEGPGARGCAWNGEDRRLGLWDLEGFKALVLSQSEQENSPSGGGKEPGPVCPSPSCVNSGTTLNLAAPQFPCR